ncbi:Small-conductance mechanosensitive channel [Pseudobythopirellula maris]|uniref:Small-conductance mechanosensitive channel n=1 Tax=Pseudobythopirellula maris TaxID=2527991 RepID=A0A5C5ZLB6_9BACT|nr:mechanosensitive ion channel family protein [Pseudobythopirellula maris]TWT88232.1 Small-conductance mechanosensitive channel [Pseudobythopirellula maris]
MAEANPAAAAENLPTDAAVDAAAEDAANAAAVASGDPDQMLGVVQSSLVDLWTDFLARLPFLAAGVVVLFAAWGASSLAKSAVRRLLARSRFKRGVRDLAQQFASVTVWVLAIIVAAVIVFPGMTPAKVLAGLGIGSVALGFAFKDIVENFLAGVLILWRFPFDPGDYIVCGDVEGRVEEVTVRMTLVRQTNGELVVLPNAQLFKEPVTVRTYEPRRRSTIIVGVSYDTDVDEAREVLRDALSGCESVSSDHPVEIFAQEYASSSINFEVTWWCGTTPLDERSSRDEVVSATKRAMDTAGIEIPFPYRTLTFKEPLPLEGREDCETAES